MQMAKLRVAAHSSEQGFRRELLSAQDSVDRKHEDFHQHQQTQIYPLIQGAKRHRRPLGRGQ